MPVRKFLLELGPTIEVMTMPMPGMPSLEADRFRQTLEDRRGTYLSLPTRSIAYLDQFLVLKVGK